MLSSFNSTVDNGKVPLKLSRVKDPSSSDLRVGTSSSLSPNSQLMLPFLLHSFILGLEPL